MKHTKYINVIFFMIFLILLSNCSQTEQQSSEQVDNQNTEEVEKETIAEIEKQSIKEAEKDTITQVETQSIEETKKDTITQVETQSIEETKKEIAGQIEKENIKKIKNETTGQVEKQNTEEQKIEAVKQVEKQSTKEAENQLDKENKKQAIGQVKQIPDKWVVPSKYKSMKNPTDPADKEGLSVGKTLYMKYCKLCHAKTGVGVGKMAGGFDLSSKEFQMQTDGELFYKTSEGKDNMPAYKKRIPDDEDRWLIVNYMRALKQK